MKKLYIFYNSQQVGWMDENFHLEYSQNWQKNGFALSPFLPLNQECNQEHVKNFIDNLLPEGKGLDTISTSTGISKNNKYALLGTIGKETTGAFVFSYNENLQPNSTFREVTKAELTQRIKDRSNIPIAIWDGKPRISVAGVQEKLNISCFEDKCGFGEGDISSTHILKFEKAQQNIVANEYLSMFLAHKAGLDVANFRIEYFEEEPVLIIERFDREIIDEHTIKKIHIIDGCQALSIQSQYKYERNLGDNRDVAHIREGVSFKKLHRFTQVCKVPLLANRGIVEWCIVNLCLGNSDAHGKNISFFADREKPSLTPFYDIVNTQLYTQEYNTSLAMAIGDAFVIENLSSLEIENFCDDMSIKASSFKKMFFDMSSKIENAMENELPEIVKENRLNTAFVARYKQDVLQRLKRLKSVVEQVGV